MRIGRTLPPAAAPLSWRDIFKGVLALKNGQGEEKRFQEELKEFFSSRHCFLTSSGKTALALILQGLSRLNPQRKAVVIPAYTCYSVPSAITRAGLKVCPCDMDLNTLDYNHDALEKTIAACVDKSSSPPLAILSIHLFGIPADVERTRRLAERFNTTVVEDAAQAMGGAQEGKKLGTLADVSFFSLGRGKAFSTVEGGVILTSKADLATELSHLMNELPSYSSIEIVSLLAKACFLQIFSNPALFWIPLSIPALRLGETIYDPDFKMRRMSGFQCGLARGWMETLPEHVQSRRQNTIHWESFFESRKNPTLQPYKARGAGLIRFPLRITDADQREAILKASHWQGLGIMPGYPDTVAGIGELEILEIEEDKESRPLPSACSMARELITLPTHSFTTVDDQERIGLLLDQSISQGISKKQNPDGFRAKGEALETGTE